MPLPPEPRRGAHRGVVDTPPELARRVARQLPHEPTAVLDPACGDGALLLAALEAAGGDPGFAQRGLFGIELDPERARRARTRLCAAAGLRSSQALEEHIVCGDALEAERPWPGGTWILANPPWSSFSGRHASPIAAPDPARLGGWPSLQGAFLARIARHVAEHGSGAAVLAPGPLTELERYGPARASVTAHARLCRPPEELGEHAFDGVTEPAVLIVLLPRDGAGARGSAEPWTVAEPRDAALIAALANFPRAPVKTFRDVGVHTGNAARELVLGPEHDQWPALRQGRDLDPYHLRPASARLCTSVEKRPGVRFRVATRARYESFPVLLRQTADRPLAALHVEPTYFRNSLLAAAEVPGLHPAFVVAVLNGSVAAAWHRAMFRDARQRSFPQVKIKHLAGQPLPIATRDDDPRLHDEVMALASIKTPDAAGIDRRVRAAFGLTRDVEARALEIAR